MANSGVIWSGTTTFTFASTGTFGGLGFPLAVLSPTPFIYIGLAAFAQFETLGNCTITFADSTTLVLSPNTDAVTGRNGAIYIGSDSRLAQGGSISVAVTAESGNGTGTLSALIVDGAWSGTPTPTFLGFAQANSAGTLNATAATSNHDLVVVFGLDERYGSQTDQPIQTTLDPGWELETEGVSPWVSALGQFTQTSVCICTDVAVDASAAIALTASGGSDVMTLNVFDTQLHFASGFSFGTIIS